MPRFFDDYSNTYLTHDSSAGRKQQRRGWKFRENFRLHYSHHVADYRRSAMGLSSAQQSFLRTHGKDHPSVPPLPDGWKEEMDDVTGIPYFIDTVTKKRSWVRPGFIPQRVNQGLRPGMGRGAPFRGGGFRGGRSPMHYQQRPPPHHLQQQQQQPPPPFAAPPLGNIPTQPSHLVGPPAAGGPPPSFPPPGGVPPPAGGPPPSFPPPGGVPPPATGGYS